MRDWVAIMEAEALLVIMDCSEAPRSKFYSPCAENVLLKSTFGEKILGLARLNVFGASLYRFKRSRCAGTELLRAPGVFCVT